MPVIGLVRKTLYDLFCGGESLKEAASKADELFRFGVRTIMDYSVEGEKTEKGFDSTLAEFIASIEMGEAKESIHMAACKLTALAAFNLLEKVQNEAPLNEKEQAAWDRVLKRVDQLAQAADKHGVPIFIDAEESWIQDTIDQISEDLMARYNREKAVVYTTIQLYRHDRLAYLQGLIQRANDQDYHLAVKLVRGAYMEKESDRAEEMGYPNPIQPDKEHTDRDYNAALKLCIEHIDDLSLCAASHNEDSARYLTELMEQKNLPPDHPRIWFAQLLSMSDHISFNLAAHGYRVAKYVPYGPVKAVIPYLIRRAEENTSVAGQASRETQLLKDEIKRRNL